MTGQRRQWIALILSGVFPGFGQLYARAWVKGSAFIVAGTVATWILGRVVSLQDLLNGFLPYPVTTFGLLVALLALYLWSMIDAWRSAGPPGA